MSAKPVMMTGVIYPLNKMNPPMAVAIVGNAWDPSLEIGGGPVYPPAGGGEPPLGIWGPTDPRPTPPIYWPGYPNWPTQPPGGGGGQPGVPTFPIWGPPGSNFPDKPGYPPVAGHPLPPIPVPPEAPNLPPPGSPPVMIGGNQPVNPIAPPPAIIVNYPGVGLVLVPLPSGGGGSAPVPPNPPIDVPPGGPPSGGDPPHVDNTLPGDLPHPEPIS